MNFNIPENCQIQKLAELYEKYFFDNNQEYKGTFVEIGAYDGFNYSNTYALSILGWKGYYFEPIEKFAEKCKINHAHNPDVKVITAAIGDEEGEFEIAVADTLSTFSKEQMQAYEEIDWASWHLSCFREGKAFVSVIRFDNAMKKFEIPSIDLMVIDVEGFEEKVLNSFDLNVVRPKMLICEIEDEHVDFKKYENINERNVRVRNLIESCGYATVYKDNINSVFVDNNT